MSIFLYGETCLNASVSAIIGHANASHRLARDLRQVADLCSRSRMDLDALPLVDMWFVDKRMLPMQVGHIRNPDGTGGDHRIGRLSSTLPFHLLSVHQGLARCIPLAQAWQSVPPSRRIRWRVGTRLEKVEMSQLPHRGGVAVSACARIRLPLAFRLPSTPVSVLMENRNTLISQRRCNPIFRRWTTAPSERAPRKHLNPLAAQFRRATKFRGGRTSPYRLRLAA